MFRNSTIKDLKGDRGVAVEWVLRELPSLATDALKGFGKSTFL